MTIALNTNGKSSNNELLIKSIIAKGANCYSDSPFLRTKRDLEIALIVDRAKTQGMDVVFHTKMVYELIGHGKSVVFLLLKIQKLQQFLL
jgi:hypothetical protein